MGWFSRAWNSVSSTVSSAASSVGSAVSNTVSTVTSTVSTAVSNTVETVSTGVSNAASWANDNIVQPVSNGVSNAASWANDNIVQPVSNGVSAAGTWVSETASAVGDWGSRQWDGIVEFTTGGRSDAQVQQALNTMREVNALAEAGDDQGLLQRSSQVVQDRINMLETQARRGQDVGEELESMRNLQTQLNNPNIDLNRTVPDPNNPNEEITLREQVRRFTNNLATSNAQRNIQQTTSNMTAAAQNLETGLVIVAATGAGVATGGLGLAATPALVVGTATSATVSQVVGVADQAGALGNPLGGEQNRRGGLIARTLTGNLENSTAGQLTQGAVSDVVSFIPIPGLGGAGGQVTNQVTNQVVQQGGRTLLQRGTTLALNQAPTLIRTSANAGGSLAGNQLDNALMTNLGTNNMGDLLAGNFPGASAPASSAPAASGPSSGTMLAGNLNDNLNGNPIPTELPAGPPAANNTIIVNNGQPGNNMDGFIWAGMETPGTSPGTPPGTIPGMSPANNPLAYLENAVAAVLNTMGADRAANLQASLQSMGIGNWEGTRATNGQGQGQGQGQGTGIA